jgi:uncharacterized membrane protein YvbJ
MIKLCANCQAENDADAILCSECGMSLRGAPTGESAAELKEEMERARLAAMTTELTPRRLREIPWTLALIWAGSATVVVSCAASFIMQISAGYLWCPSGSSTPAFPRCSPG